ncbi:hypothetical protein ACFOD9_09295 [Novosphingobium bradum]|uniref:Uncharacterized protein n=1 Tax=Novosphingobium bradum TaxID=1737444 RepID=A0ABV7IW60_9SPHN
MASPSPENSLHLWRSRAIDAFASAEASIDLLLRKANLPSKGDLLSARIERLRKAKPSAGWPEERKNKLNQILVELAALLPLRNDIVHAPMIVRTDRDQAIACFANPTLQCEFSRFTREVPAPRLQALAGKASYLAKALEAV